MVWSRSNAGSVPCLNRAMARSRDTEQHAADLAEHHAWECVKVAPSCLLVVRPGTLRK